MLTVDLSAIRANVEALRRAAGDVLFMAVVKDNAYGHGLVPVAQAAVEAGADWLGIVHVREGIALRQAGIASPLLVLGYVPPEEIPAAVQHKLDVPLMNLEHATLVRAQIPVGQRLRVHLKVETGLQRFGVSERELLELARFAGFLPSATGQQSPFVPVGIYSHLAAVEETELDFTKSQIDRFTSACQSLGADHHGSLVRHIAATAATLVLPESRFDMVRCGIGVYGLWPSTDVKRLVKNDGLLRPALSWTKPIRALKTVPADAPVGYGCTWRPARESTVALLDVGYADGFDRSLSSKAVVEVNRQTCPVVGRICSNVTFIDVTAVGNVSVGDDVTLISSDPNSPASMDAQAERAGTINYELAMRLSPDLEREYRE
ncbi:alanine racemase [Candidatus Berkelbacteria bacterium]|nr:alanine racemase [Candidatus Berkelbacteria bacterium]